MKNNRKALWLLLVSQTLILVSGLLQPPSSLLMTILRLVIPFIVVAYVGLMLAGIISPRKM